MNSTSPEFREPESQPSYSEQLFNRKWQIAVVFAAGFLAALICLGFVLYSVRKENRELKDQLKNQTATMLQLRAEANEAELYKHDLESLQNQLSTAVIGPGSRKPVTTRKNKTQSKAVASSLRTFANPVWNVWAEVSADPPNFKPQKLQPNHDYSLVINLAALHYDEDQSDKEAGVYSKDISATFRDWIDNPENKDLESANIDVLIVPDRVHFRPQGQSEAFKSMKIKLSKIRDAKKNGFSISGSALNYLHSHGGDDGSPFSFGLKTFQIKTTDEPGVGYISVSIWKNDRPIGEIQYRTCIVKELTDPCKLPDVPESTFKGIDLRDSSQLPTAALHLIDRQSDIVGIFHCHACPDNSQEYLTWEVSETVESFSRQIKAIIRRLGTLTAKRGDESDEDFATRKEREYLETSHASSEALYNLIFGSKKDSDGLKAKAAFINFVNRFRRFDNGENAPPPTLFVRLIPSLPSLVLTPIGLLEVAPDGLETARLTAEPDYGPFVGFYVDIQTPLEIQDYSAPKDCVSKWAIFVPPLSTDPVFGAVEDARTSFSGWIEGFRSACGPCVMDDEDEVKFRHFLNGDGPDAGLILMLSHHSDDFGLYFNESFYTPAILPSDVGRTFNSDSIAILGACGTAEPGGSEFISKFNEMGVRSVIATTTSVDPSMTGRFLSLFLDSFNSTLPTNTIGQARFRAVRALSRLQDSANGPLYGPRALVFILVGNAGRQLCVPPKGSESVATTPSAN